MKKIFFLFIVVSIFAINANAQVTIGSKDAPATGAVLELKSTELGFLPTRVSLTGPSDAAPLPEHVPGMIVFNTNATDSLQVGLYYNWNSKWVSLSSTPFTTENWFYMPSIVIDVSGTGGTVDLYDEYKKQLNTNSGAGSLVVNSTGAPAKALATIPAADDLFYYVTAYDDRVFEDISITASGVMTYKIVTGATADDATFMNIVFVEK